MVSHLPGCGLLTSKDLGVEPQHETGLTNQEADNLVHLDELSTDVEVSEQNLGFLKVPEVFEIWEVLK